MNKEALAKAVATKLEVTIKDAKVIVDSVFEAVEDGLVEHGEVTLGGLGKLVTVEKAARTARNPKTGESIDVPAKTGVKLKPSKALKDTVNQ